MHTINHLSFIDELIYKNIFNWLLKVIKGTKYTVRDKINAKY